MSDRIHEISREANNPTVSASVAADAYEKGVVLGGGMKGTFDADAHTHKHFGPGPEIMGMESGSKTGGGEGDCPGSKAGGAGAHGGGSKGHEEPNLTKHMEASGLKR